MNNKSSEPYSPLEKILLIFIGGIACWAVIKWILPSSWLAALTILLFASGFLGVISSPRKRSQSRHEPTAGKNSRGTTSIAKGTSNSKPNNLNHFNRWGAAGVTPNPAPDQKEWNLDLLRDIEWKRFEDVCAQFYTLNGVRSETTPLGPDGGVDIRLFQDGTGKVTTIIQCKAWGYRKVGIKPVRELLGVMAHEKIPCAFFITTGNFTEEAQAFASSNNIRLIHGEQLLAMIRSLPEEDQGSLLEYATAGDYKTPTCPTCGIKMKHVVGQGGKSDFWGCPSYPKCRQTLGMRRSENISIPASAISAYLT